MDLRQPRQLWEIYSGESRMTQIASSLGLDAQHFGLNHGWNFSYKSHQREFMKFLDEFQPEEVYLSPTCGPWSPMQATSRLAPSGTSQVLPTNLFETDLRGPSCPHWAANSSHVMAHQGLLQPSWLSCQVQPMSVWLSVQGWQWYLAANPKGHRSPDLQTSCGPGDESSLPWWSRSLPPWRFPARLSSSSNFLHGELPAGIGIDLSCGNG